jgi:3,4-dihydroxy 2-butanone 4-phosphate synthase / GTP cyclohydrolase II
METIEAIAKLPTKYGQFIIHAYKNKINEENICLIKGDITKQDDILVRIHSECLTGEVLHSKRCDCGEQLNKSLKLLSKEKNSMLIYLRQEGRGIGLFNKIKAYHLQDNGLDTVQANVKLGRKADERNYSVAAQMLQEFGIKKVKLLTNNPAKINSLEKHGIIVSKRVALKIKQTKENKTYLQTKKKKMGHLL